MGSRRLYSAVERRRQWEEWHTARGHGQRIKCSLAVMWTFSLCMLANCFTSLAASCPRNVYLYPFGGQIYCLFSKLIFCMQNIICFKIKTRGFMPHGFSYQKANRLKIQIQLLLHGHSVTWHVSKGSPKEWKRKRKNFSFPNVHSYTDWRLPHQALPDRLTLQLPMSTLIASDFI